MPTWLFWSFMVVLTPMEAGTLLAHRFPVFYLMINSAGLGFYLLLGGVSAAYGGWLGAAVSLAFAAWLAVSVVNERRKALAVPRMASTSRYGLSGVGDGPSYHGRAEGASSRGCDWFSCLNRGFRPHLEDIGA